MEKQACMQNKADSSSKKTSKSLVALNISVTLSLSSLLNRLVNIEYRRYYIADTFAISILLSPRL